MTRRAAMTLLAGLAGNTQTQARDATQTCGIPEVIELGMGNGACAVRQIVVRWSNLTARISPQELLEALGGKVE